MRSIQLEMEPEQQFQQLFSRYKFLKINELCGTTRLIPW